MTGRRRSRKSERAGPQGKGHGHSARSFEVPVDLHDRLVVAYHGCERTLARKVLLGEAELEPSMNDYDWLGTGIYFWEHGLGRARDFAEEKGRRGELEDPFVIGAYLHLGACLDLTDVWATRMFGHCYKEMRARVWPKDRTARPENSPAIGSPDLLLRRLDCAVINYCLRSSDVRARRESRPFGYDAVRGAFEEGRRAFPGAGVREKTHIQLSVRNEACILGVFRPTGYSL